MCRGPNGWGVTCLPAAIFFQKATPLAQRLSELHTPMEQQQELFNVWQALAEVLQVLLPPSAAPACSLQPPVCCGLSAAAPKDMAWLSEHAAATVPFAGVAPLLVLSRPTPAQTARMRGQCHQC